MGQRESKSNPTKHIKVPSRPQSQEDNKVNVKNLKKITSNTAEFAYSNPHSPLVTFSSNTFRSFTLRSKNEESNVDLDYVLNLETDERVCMTHRESIKIFGLISENIEGKKLSALELNQISVQLDFKGYINIMEISAILPEILQKKKYSIGSILKIYKFVHKVIERSRVPSGVILNIFNTCKVKKMNEVIGNDEVIFILTRIIKITIVGVD